MAKNLLFGGLVKTTTWAGYEASKVAGKLVFAELEEAEGKKAGKYIWANGIEYYIADADDLAEAIERIEALEDKTEEIDSSIDRLDSSVSALETWKATIDEWKAALSLGAADNKISIEGVDGEVEIAGDGYVKAATADSKITLTLDASQIVKGEKAGASTKLATEGFVEEAVEKAQGDVTDLSTYVHDVVDASIDELQAKDEEIDSSIDALQADMADASARIKKAITEVGIAATVADETATVTLSGKQEDGTALADDSFTVKGDSYVKVGGAADAITLTAQVSNSSSDIADASKADAAKLASDYAVKSYVEDKLSGLEGALVFKGGVASEAELPADAEKGDVWVLTEGAEAGDLFISKGDGTWVRVERNLDGAVTADGALTADKVVLGDGSQKAKASEFGIGADSSHAAAEKTIATEKHVEAMIAEEDASVAAAIEDAIGDLAISAAVTKGGEYIDASVDAADNKKINVALDVAESLDTAVEGQLADAKQVKDAIDAAGGELSARAAEASKVGDANGALIDLTSASSTTIGDLGTVAVKSGDIKYVNVAGAENEITVSAVTCTLADASNGSTGLATAEDVQAVIAEVEETTAAALASLNTKIADVSNAVDTEAAAREAEDDAINTRIDNLDGTALKVGGEEDEWKDKTIEEAIVDLSTKISHQQEGSVTYLNGETAIEGGESKYVAVSVDKHVGEITISSNVAATVAADHSLVEGQAATADSSLATDGYVKDEIAYALAWEVIE